MTTRRDTWSLLLIGVLVVAAAGCASGTESMTSATPIDLPSLAGTWQGTARGPQGLSQPMTMKIGADGTYSMDGDVYTARGTAQVTGGKLVLTPTTTTGGQAAGRVATAVFSEKRQPSQVIQTLTGSGASSAGPYSFEVSRPKQ
jgi:hypothetical protein